MGSNSSSSSRSRNRDENRERSGRRNNGGNLGGGGNTARDATASKSGHCTSTETRIGVARGPEGAAKDRGKLVHEEESGTHNTV